jgi:hypothetical protein
VFPGVVFLLSLFVFAVVTLGAGYALWYYRGRFRREERRAAVVIGVSLAMFLPAMYFAENILPGRPGELVATSVLIAICVVAVGTVWRILARPRQDP